MRFPRRRSSADILGSNQTPVNAFPQEIFYDDRLHPVPPYLEVKAEPATSAEQEADAAAGGATQSVLKRVSSFGLM